MTIFIACDNVLWKSGQAYVNQWLSLQGAYWLGCYLACKLRYSGYRYAAYCVHLIKEILEVTCWDRVRVLPTDENIVIVVETIVDALQFLHHLHICTYT